MNISVTINAKSQYVNEIEYSVALIFEDLLGYNCIFSISDEISSVIELKLKSFELKFNTFLVEEDIYSANPFGFHLVQHETNQLLEDEKLLQKVEKSILELQFKNNTVVDKYILFDDSCLETNIDFFGTSFFIASRFEERLIKNRDKHGRFQYKDSILCKNDYILRPIINEYAFFLEECIFKLGFKSEIEPKHIFEIHPTHDVDYPFLFYRTNIEKFLKEIYGEYLKSGLKEALDFFLKGINTLIFNRKDPFDFHLEMLAISSSLSRISTFNFMVGFEKGGYNGYYDLSQFRVRKLIRSIIKAGHNIGFHPSYNTVSDYKLFYKELKELKKISKEISDDIQINEGRHHYLRFDINSTFDFWDSANLRYDSTMGFAEHPGFRTGLCCTHSIFSLSRREKLSLKEKPLALMDVSLTSSNYMDMDISEMYEIAKQLKDTIKKYNGQFVVLFHNDWFYTDYKNRIAFYKFVLS